MNYILTIGKPLSSKLILDILHGESDQFERILQKMFSLLKRAIDFRFIFINISIWNLLPAHITLLKTIINHCSSFFICYTRNACNKAFEREHRIFVGHEFCKRYLNHKPILFNLCERQETLTICIIYIIYFKIIWDLFFKFWKSQTVLTRFNVVHP